MNSCRRVVVCFWLRIQVRNFHVLRYEIVRRDSLREVRSGRWGCRFRRGRRCEEEKRETSSHHVPWRVDDPLGRMNISGQHVDIICEHLKKSIRRTDENRLLNHTNCVLVGSMMRRRWQPYRCLRHDARTLVYSMRGDWGSMLVGREKKASHLFGRSVLENGA